MTLYHFRDSISRNVKLKKIPFISYYLLRLPLFFKKRKARFVLNKPLLIFKKSNYFFPVFNNYKFLIHIGKFKRMFIGTKQHNFFRFGEFFFTRRFGRGDIIHQRKKKKKSKR